MTQNRVNFYFYLIYFLPRHVNFNLPTIERCFEPTSKMAVLRKLNTKKINFNKNDAK